MPGEIPHIVVALDGSTHAERAVPIAMRIANALPAAVRFIQVEQGHSSPDEAVRRQRDFEAYAGRLLAVCGHIARGWSAEVLAGEPAEVLLREGGQSRLMVMADHGAGGLRARFSGSVVDRVVRASAVPVLVVSSETEGQLTEGPIVVGLDGSREAEEGLTLARELAAAMSLPLVLVRAWEPVPPAGLEFVPGATTIALEHASAADAYLARVHRPGEEFVVMAGPPVSAIRQAADRLDASIVVLTSRGKGLAARLALGSTTEGVRRQLARPILIVPVPSPGDGGASVSETSAVRLRR